MKSLAQRLLLNVLLKIGFKPTFNYLIDILEDEAKKSKNEYTIAGVNALRAIGYVEELTLQNILVAVVNQLDIEAKKTSNEYDDKVVAYIKELIIKEAYKFDLSLDIFIVHLDKYVKSTPNRFDDMLPSILKEIRTELSK